MKLRFIVVVIVCIVILTLATRGQREGVPIHILSTRDEAGNARVMIGIRESATCPVVVDDTMGPGECAIYKIENGQTQKYTFNQCPREENVRHSFAKFVKMCCKGTASPLFLVTNVSSPEFRFEMADLNGVCTAVREGNLGVAMFANGRKIVYSESLPVANRLPE
jgi:hypothetical protein